MSLEILKDYEQIKAEIFVKAAGNKDLIKERVLEESSQIEGVGALHFAYNEGVEEAIDYIVESFTKEGIQIMVDVTSFKQSLKDQFGEVVDESATAEQLFEVGYKLASTTARQNF